MPKFFQMLYSLIRCPLNHDWELMKADGPKLEQRCRKCGKRVTHSI